MGDGGLWFKLWVRSAADPNLCLLPIADYGRWCKLGVYTKEHGTDGIVTVSKPSDPGIVHPLQSAFQVDTFEEMIGAIHRAPNIQIREVPPETFASVSFEIKWRNWWKYQGDFSTNRVRKHRAKKGANETLQKRREEKRQEENLEPPIVPHDQTRYFADFWSAYPRKVGKQQAEKAWAKLCPSPVLSQTILSALLTQCAWPSWTRDGGQFIPHPATWLNGRRWEDEPMDPIAAEIPPQTASLGAVGPQSRAWHESRRHVVEQTTRGNGQRIWRCWGAEGKGGGICAEGVEVTPITEGGKPDAEPWT